MVHSSQELTRFRLLRKKILNLPTVEPEISTLLEGGRTVKEAFKFVPAQQLITGTLIWYEERAAEIRIFCPALDLYSFEEVSAARLQDSPFAIPPKKLCMPGNYSLMFTQERPYRNAYLKLLSFYKWVVTDRCGLDITSHPKDPLSQKHKDAVVAHMNSAAD